MNAEKSRLRIALVCNTAWAIYTYRRGLLRMLIERGVEVTVIAPRDRTFELLEEMGCRCVELPVASKGTNPRDDLQHAGRAVSRIPGNPAAHGVSLHDQAEHLRFDRRETGGRAVDCGHHGPRLCVHPEEPDGERREAALPFCVPVSARSVVPESGRPAAFIDQNLLVHPERARLLHGEGVDLGEYAFSRYRAPTRRRKAFFSF